MLRLLLLTLPALSGAVIRGLSWYGYEVEHSDLMCRWQNPISWHLQNIKSLGFNTIRLPFSWDFIQKGDWTSMDEFFSEVQKLDLNVTLDFHRIHKEHQSAKPYDDVVSFDSFLKAWETILLRYQHVPQLGMIDIFNEFQSGTAWQEWNNLARQIVNYVENKFPGRFSYMVGGYAWGGNLKFVDLSDLPFHKERIFYTIHKYHFSDKEPLEDSWDYSFGDHKVVVNVGEFGYMSDDPKQKEWMQRFMNWLVINNIKDTYWWTYSWNSGDTGGILLDSGCTNVDWDKMNLIKDFWRRSEESHRNLRTHHPKEDGNPWVIVFSNATYNG